MLPSTAKIRRRIDIPPHLSFRILFPYTTPMASIGKTERPEKQQSEIVKRFRANPLVFVGTVLVLIIVIVAFVLVPAFVPDAGGAQFDTTFGYYGNAPISFVAGNYFANVREQIARSYGGMDGAGYERFIWREAFNAAAFRTAVLEEARLSGYTPPDAVVDKAVAQLDAFQENGRFSVVRYRSLDNGTRSRIWKEEQESLAIMRYLADTSTLLTGEAEKAFISMMAEKQRKFDIAAFTVSDYPAEETAAYIRDNAGLFKTVHLSQITVTSNEGGAQTILDDIKAGRVTFEEAARTQSTDNFASRGGDMGSKMAFEFATVVTDEESRSLVLSLPAGELSAVITVPTGWAFFRAEEAPRDANPADSADIDKARSYLLSFQRGVIEDYWLDEAQSFIETAAVRGFDNACYEAGIEKSTIGPLPVNFGDSELFTTIGSYSIDALSSAPSSENFWNTAFSTPVGSASQPIVLGSYIVVLQPVEEIMVDAEDRSAIESYYAVSNNSNFETRLSQTLLKNKKFKDRFDAVFSKLYREG